MVFSNCSYWKIAFLSYLLLIAMVNCKNGELPCTELNSYNFFMASNIPFLKHLICKIRSRYANDLRDVLFNPAVPLWLIRRMNKSKSFWEKLYDTIQIKKTQTKTVLNLNINTEHAIRGIVSKNHRLAGKIKVLSNSSNELYYGVDGFQCECDISDINHLDIIVDYSIPNIHHILSSGKYPSYHQKLVYIPAMLYSYEPNHHHYYYHHNNSVMNTMNSTSSNRSIHPVITSFYFSGKPRREQFVRNMISNGIAIWNTPQTTDIYVEMKQALDNSKILLNIHQSDDVFTVEELRILPALLRGCIVISEDSPLKEDIPYYEYIIWSTLEDFPRMTKHVLDNYEEYFNQIHGPESKLGNILDRMKQNAYEDLRHVVNSSLYQKSGGNMFLH